MYSPLFQLEERDLKISLCDRNHNYSQTFQPEIEKYSVFSFGVGWGENCTNKNNHNNPFV